jgi:hypothetical protein
MEVTKEFILGQLKGGESNAKTSHIIYTEYKKLGGSSSYQIFFRKLRLVIEELRRGKVKVIGNDRGYYLAESDGEWERYERKCRSKVYSEVETIAKCKGLSVVDVVKNWFFLKSGKRDNETLPLFGEKE